MTVTLNPHSYSRAEMPDAARLDTYARVTSVIGVTSKPGLENWRLDMGREEADRLSQEGRDFGSRMDVLVSDFLNGKIESSPSDNMELEYCLMGQFADWWSMNMWQTAATQLRVWHDGLRVAGTLDAIGWFGGVSAIVDCKGAKRIYPDNWVQVAAYKGCLEWMVRRGLLPSGVPIPRKMLVWWFNRETEKFACKFAPKPYQYYWAEFKRRVGCYQFAHPKGGIDRGAKT